MEYRVKTNMLNNYRYGMPLQKTKNGEAFYCDEVPMAKPISKEVIERNPQWFEKVQPDVQEGQYWEWDNYIYRITSIGSLVHLNNISSESDQRAWSKDVLLRDARLLSDDEVEQALIKEAKRRGLDQVGTAYSDAKRGNKETVGHHYSSSVTFRYVSSSFHTDGLTDGCGGWIYYEGQWAEIIEDEWEVYQNNEGETYISNNDYEIRKHGGGITELGFTDEESELIANQLNNL